mmetsp:Transcript_8452/g.24028  ORF Transcript_8452/g.24028 Transcript_8452/m.24028 type:complete len:95 (+) Transcript_8452:330-614(+)
MRHIERPSITVPDHRRKLYGSEFSTSLGCSSSRARGGGSSHINGQSWSVMSWFSTSHIMQQSLRDMCASGEPVEDEEDCRRSTAYCCSEWSSAK